MAATSRTIDYDALLSLTADMYHKKGVVQDGVFNSNIILKTLRDKGFKTEETGGAKIQSNIMYGKSSTIGSYSTYEVLDVAPQDGVTAAFFDWCQYSGAVSIDGMSKFKNSGKSQIQSLLAEKTKQATMSFSERMNEDLMDIDYVATSTTGNGGKNIISIPNLIKYDPTSGTVGGIDQGVSTWWANHTKTSAATTYEGLNAEMRNMFNNCTKGTGGSPDVMIADQLTFEQYETGMDERVRYSYTDNASVGFENIKFKSAKLFWDVTVPDASGGLNFDDTPLKGAIYFLNSEFLNYCIGKGFDFSPQGFKTPVDQDASTALYLFYGQLIANNLRKHGVIGNISRSLG